MDKNRSSVSQVNTNFGAYSPTQSCFALLYQTQVERMLSHYRIIFKEGKISLDVAALQYPSPWKPGGLCGPLRLGNCYATSWLTELGMFCGTHHLTSTWDCVCLLKSNVRRLQTCTILKTKKFSSLPISPQSYLTASRFSLILPKDKRLELSKGQTSERRMRKKGWSWFIFSWGADGFINAKTFSFH